SSLDMRGGALIGSSSFGRGSAGSITVSVTGPVSLAGSDGIGDFTGILTQSTVDGSPASAGMISLSAASLSLVDGALIDSSTSGMGKAGRVNVNVAGAAVLDGSSITTTSESSDRGGDAGSISLTSGSLQLLNGAQITSKTAGLGKGGDIVITVA